jgi:tetratricopeptide (TPR) repeat protein
MIARLATTVVLLLAGARAQETSENPFRPFDRAAFEAHLTSLGATAEQLAQFATAVADGSVDLAADSLLRSLVPALAAAANASENGEPKAALELAKLAAETQDPFVRAHARYHLGRTMVDNDDPEAAAEVLGDFLRHDRNRTPLDAEVAFFFASALADIPSRESAIAAFSDYLALFPEAPERFRAVAAQRRAELEAQFENALHELADEMQRTERDLKKSKTGQPTQDRQKEIVEQLQKIIEQMEEQEKKSSGAPSGNGPSMNPASKSALPEGAGRVGTLGKAPPAGDRWTRVKDRERDEVNVDIQAKLPERYRKLLEQYYDRLSKPKDRK